MRERERRGERENKERTEGKQEREQQFIIDYIPSKKYACISAVRKQLACSSGTVTMSLFVAF